MDNHKSFELLRDEFIEEYRTRARLYRHIQTGAQVLSLENDDENKVFGVTFRTPPPDSTGIAHILEHSVLGGSQKYPLKEPFVQLLKGSLKTFLNAMTYPDRTVYPVASTNQQDFYNLVDVYLDAVFFPLITENHLLQEGWHYEMAAPDAPLTYKGVVFNEMKGAYSSPDGLLYRYSQQTLFPDTIYGQDSGGDPEVIPDLTYEQFKHFHTTYYHPSNALLYFYGDDDPQERLRILDEVLSRFDAQPVDALASLQLQPSFRGPREITKPYSVDPGAPAKAWIQLNWLLPEGDDPALVMALSVLSYALVGTQASPLRKTLIDSGLGEDVTGGGLSSHLRQMTFSVGMKGVKPEETGAVESLILQTLSRLSSEGFDPELIEAALNTFEFSLRENNTGSFPRGLSLMMRVVNAWTYDRDLLAPLAFEKPLADVRGHIENDPNFLKNLIQIHLVDNPHRVTLTLEPDPELNHRLETEEKERLQAVRAALDEQAVSRIIQTAQTLKELQERPDAPEDLARLPSLGLEDLDREIKTIPLEVQKLPGARADDARLLYHDLFTNGILYLDLAFDLRRVPLNLLPYARLFGTALIEMGTQTESYVKLIQRIGRKTGGVWPSSLLSARRREPDGIAYLTLSGKATVAQTPDLLDILRDVLLTVKLDDRDRFRQIVLKAKASKESGLIPGGHAVVDSRLRAAFDPIYLAGERMGGIDYLFFLRKLVDEIDTDWEGVLNKLEHVRRLIVNRSEMVVNATLDAENWAQVEPQLRRFLATLPASAATPSQWTNGGIDPTTNEGLSIPAQVNYVAKGTDLYALGYQLHGSVSVITNLLRTGYLWDRVRVQGGAYGAFCRFSQQSGVFSYMSYRDPNLLATLDVYDAAADFLRNVDLSQDELTKSIIGAIGVLDAYQLPDAKGETSMTRYLLGESDEERQKYRDEVLGTTLADFRAFADVLSEAARVARIVVMGSADALAAANKERGDFLQIRQVL